MKKRNVIWILGESIRNYPGNDQFSQYPILRELSTQGILFENMVVTAPSTIMSQSSMFTGQPATYLSRTFADFKYNPEQFTSLYSVLKNQGYHCYAGFYHIEGNQLFKELMPLIDSSDLPEGLRHNTFWTSEDVNSILCNLLQKKPKEPFFLLLNYNNQENTNERISEAIQHLKDSPYFNDSIFLFCSDHGFPDMSRGDLAKKHEINVSNPSILINFFLRYPSCMPSTVKTFTSTLDIFPTLLDILGIPQGLYNLEGNSLFSLLNKKNAEDSDKNKINVQRKFRIDGRYLFQNDRIVCICDQEFKLNVHFKRWSIVSEEFFAMNDVDEKNNLIRQEEFQSKIKEFRKEFAVTEKKLEGVHFNYLRQKCQENLKLYFMKKGDIPQQVLVIGTAHPVFLKSVLFALSAPYSVRIDLAAEPGAFQKEDLLGDNLRERVMFYNLKTNTGTFEFKKSYQKELQRPEFSKYSGKIGVIYQIVDGDHFITNYPQLCEKEYDLVIIPLDNPYGVGHQQAVQLVKKLKTKEVIYFDYNMDVKNPSHWFVEGFRRFNKRRRHYFANPKSFLFEMKRYGYALGFFKDPTLKRKIK